MELEKIIKAIQVVIDAGGTIFVCGNGGSASTAEHFTNDLFKKRIKAICLNSNVSIITMLSNDLGYTYIFKEQMDVLASMSDILVMFSVSGNSGNQRSCLFDEYDTVAILGMNGIGALQKADYVYSIDSDDYGLVESEHLSIAHKISEVLHG
jgi:D-sedoheptulose 7-phosphate isomerase